MSGTPLGVALRALAEAAPERPALTHDDRTVTRAELDRRTNRLARAYAGLGVKPDAFVTIGLPNGIEFFEAASRPGSSARRRSRCRARLPAREREAIIELAEPRAGRRRATARGAGRRAPRVAAGFEPDAALSDAPLPDRAVGRRGRRRRRAAAPGGRS